VNKEIMKKVGFVKELEQIEMGNCPLCHNKVEAKDFEDELSVKEFKISGICQSCQDKIWERKK